MKQAPKSGRKVLNAADMKSRRAFLKQAARKSLVPTIIAYSVHKMSPPAFGRTPI